MFHTTTCLSILSFPLDNLCSRVRMRDTTFSSKAYGTHEYKDLSIEGRVQFDVFIALQRDHKLSSYSLNAVR
jgi:DNA polymerase delta subunit 1